MIKTGQTVKWEITKEDHGKFLNQTITDIYVDNENYAYGLWNGHLVASFHIDNGTWFVM